jgi:hypothetical protein
MGKTKKTLLFLGVFLVLLVGGRVMVGMAHQESDKSLIQKALAESIKASREGRAGGVMDKLSSQLKFNGSDYGSAGRDISRFIRDSRPDITVENDDPVISGDEGTIVSPVDLKLSMLGQSLDRHLKKVTMVFRKEDARDWLVIPVRKWKLAEVEVSESAVSDLGMQ